MLVQITNQLLLAPELNILQYMMEGQKIKKSVGGKLFKQFSVRDGEIPMVGKKVVIIIWLISIKEFYYIWCKYLN